MDKLYFEKLKINIKGTSGITGEISGNWEFVLID